MINIMTAEEARKKADEQIKNVDLEYYLLITKGRIDYAIEKKKDKYSIIDPHIFTEKVPPIGGEKTTILSGEMLRQFKKFFTDKGYTWTDYDDPDPGRPGSRGYSVLSWEKLK